MISSAILIYWQIWMSRLLTNVLSACFLDLNIHRWFTHWYQSKGKRLQVRTGITGLNNRQFCFNVEKILNSFNGQTNNLLKHPTRPLKMVFYLEYTKYQVKTATEWSCINKHHTTWARFKTFFIIAKYATTKNTLRIRVSNQFPRNTRLARICRLARFKVVMLSQLTDLHICLIILTLIPNLPMQTNRKWLNNQIPEIPGVICNEKWNLAINTI